MFKIIDEIGRELTVYTTNINSLGRIDFLVWHGGEWKWLEASVCKPID